MQYRLGELFCGPGGIAWGATHADIGNSDYSIVHQWANDYDANTCETYRHNICPDAPQTVYHEDIRKFDMSKLAPIDALAFGFPCNDYSVVGEQKGMDGVYGPLYSYGVKALKRFKPQWFLAENVGGLRNANDGTAFTKILTELRDAGYTITPHLYKFEEYGIPQARHRIIIVGIRNDEPGRFTFSDPAPHPEQTPTVGALLQDLMAEAGWTGARKWAKQADKIAPTIVGGSKKHGGPDLGPTRARRAWAEMQVEGKSIADKAPDPEFTGMPRLTPRMIARIQGFPDTWVFGKTKTRACRMIGNAFPPPVAKAVGEKIKEALYASKQGFTLTREEYIS